MTAGDLPRRIRELPSGSREALERRLGGAWAEAPSPIPPRADRTRHPLSFAQQRLWFLDRLEPGLAYSLPILFHLRGRLDRAALDASLAEILRRHESLRARFPSEGGEPVQQVEPDARPALSFTDLSSLPPDERAAAARRVVQERGGLRFDLGTGPLARFDLVRLDDGEHRLLVNFHHIVCDGWSLAVFRRELAELYTAFAAGRPSPLPELTLQYADFAAWQTQQMSGLALEGHLEHWRRTLHGAPVLLELPTDRARPPVQTQRGGRHLESYDGALLRRLEDFGRRQGATLYMVLLAGLGALLHRCTGQTDVCIGTPIARRDHAELENLIGVFVNTLVMRLDFDGEPGFRESLARARRAALDAYDHQALPFEKLVQELGVERHLAHTPLFQVLLAVHNLPDTSPDPPGLQMTREMVDLEAARFDLSLDALRRAERLDLVWSYRSDLFDASSIERLGRQLRTLLEAAIGDPERPVAALPLLGATDREDLARWNDTSAETPAVAVHALLEDRARRQPDATAVEGPGGTLSYRELNEMADGVARRLRALGAGPGRLVAVLADRSERMLAALLAVLKSGAAYVPLDPEHPHERLGFVLADSGATLLLGHGRGLEAWRSSGVPLVDMDRSSEERRPAGATESCAGATPDDLAYVIYTSGSTGRPKGVRVTHRGVVNLLLSMALRPGLSKDDSLLAVTTVSFDIAALELFGPLAAGGRVVIASSEETRDGRALARRLERSRASVMQATPTTWRLLLDSGWKPARKLRILCGGEALPRELAERLLGTGADVYNLYGPTECTIWSTIHAVAHGEGPVPIGRPIANTEAHVVDASLQPVPVGIPGELLLGGQGVARGYLGRDELTAERFVPDPFRPGSEARLYRTGDLVRRRPDGRLVFLGRLDDQVKLRGHRIELGEIEAALAALPEVRTSAAALDAATPGNERLIAFLVPTGAARPDDEALRRSLGLRLPAYMVPARFVWLERLPLTPNGKIDRRALPALALENAARGAAARSETLPPRNDLEARLVDIWERLLEVRPVGVRDSFFALGGHSLLATRLFAEVERVLGVSLPLQVLFEIPTIEHLAEHASRATPFGGRILIPLQPAGSRRPLFAVHAGGGFVHFYDPLARRLGPDRPLLALQPPGGLDGRDPPYHPHATVEALAAAYLDELRARQPRGPYLLAGTCFGGVVAFEIAHRLRAAGETVRLLALFDAYAPASLLPAAARLGQHARALELLGAPERARYVMRRVRATATVALARAQARVKTRRRALWAERERRRHLARGLRVPLEVLYTGFTAASERIAKCYRPRPIDVPLVLFQAGIAGVDGLNGWSGLSTTGIELYRRPGTHLDMLEEPQVSEVAALLRARLDTADPD